MSIHQVRQNAGSGFPAIARDIELVEALLQTSAGLAAVGRPVDLRGLDDAIGRLCGLCLNLPPEMAPALCTGLARLDARLGDLARTLGGAGGSR